MSTAVAEETKTKLNQLEQLKKFTKVVADTADFESIKDSNGKETKRCLIWTDTWLKRAGKWQIMAAQDTTVPCDP